MPLSVIIPSHGRPARLRNCLDGLARQTRPPAEVRVGLDGGTHADAQALRAAFADRLPGLHVHAVPHRGYMPLREALRAAATAPLTLSLNDDVRPAPQLVAAHAALHDAAHPVVGVGYSPWVPPADPDRFDRLVAETGLVFFDPVAAVARREALNYRHAVGLNVSFPTALAADLGGFADFPHAYGYEDIELAWRLTHRGRATLRFDPAARADHDHRYRPADLLRREYYLGRAAWLIAARNPAFAAELFGRDLRSAEESAYTRMFLRHQRADAVRYEPLFLALADEPADGATPASLVRDAQGWTLLKRYLWRWGLHDAAARRDARYRPLGDAPPLPD